MESDSDIYLIIKTGYPFEIKRDCPSTSEICYLEWQEIEGKKGSLANCLPPSDNYFVIILANSQTFLLNSSI